MIRGIPSAVWGTALAAILFGCLLAGCSPTQRQAAVTVAVDATACAADAAKISGISLASAATLATDPNCIAALNTLANTGTPATATVGIAKPAT
jgi:hypothetical protein